MKRKYWLIFPVLVLVVFSFTSGCGIPQADYNTAIAQVAALEAEKAAAETQITALTAEKNALESEKQALEVEVASLTDEQSALQNTHNDLVDANADLELIYENLNDEKMELETQYNATAASLEEISQKFPLKSFESSYQLQQWLNNNGVSDKPITTTFEGWYRRALEVQSDAMNDGYLISVDYDVFEDDTFGVYCITVINGTLWYWDPETDDIFEGVVVD